MNNLTRTLNLSINRAIKNGRNTYLVIGDRNIRIIKARWNKAANCLECLALGSGEWISVPAKHRLEEV